MNPSGPITLLILPGGDSTAGLFACWFCSEAFGSRASPFEAGIWSFPGSVGDGEDEKYLIKKKDENHRDEMEFLSREFLFQEYTCGLKLAVLWSFVVGRRWTFLLEDPKRHRLP